MKKSIKNLITLSVAVIMLSITPNVNMMAQSGSGSGHVSYHQLFSSESQGKDGTVVQQSMTRGTIVGSEASNPFHLTTQTCSGTNILSAKGQPIESCGSCDGVDADGDIWWLTYHNNPDGKNTWKIIGGTGKYKKMTGGGTTTPMMASPDGKMLTITFEGSWKM